MRLVERHDLKYQVVFVFTKLAVPVMDFTNICQIVDTCKASTFFSFDEYVDLEMYVIYSCFKNVRKSYIEQKLKKPNNNLVGIKLKTKDF